VWDESTDEILDAQVSTYVYANRAKDRARIVNPAVMSWIDAPLDFFVNVPGECNAYSTGIEVLAGKNISLAASYRKGGPLSLKRGDTTLANAHVPDRIGFSAAFLGIKGTTIAARTSKDSWSRMQGLGSSNVFITDGWDTSVGADVLGPRLGDRVIQLRAGARWRTLPFGLVNSSVKEKSYSFGFGTLLARGRAAFDVAGIRADRSANTLLNISESAWTLSVGVTVRP